MTHLTIEPSILYVGTPVELVSTDNGDGTFNLAPMSSAWAFGADRDYGRSLPGPGGQA